MPKHTSPLYKLSRDFLRCGIIGWCMEIVFTAMDSIRRRNLRLTGSTSLWMFPIYGSAALLQPLSRLLRNRSLWFRGFTYMSIIYALEFVSGSFLKRRNACPWDYGRSKYHIGRVIRLDYAPTWFIAGLVFERVLGSRPPRSAGQDSQ